METDDWLNDNISSLSFFVDLRVWTEHTATLTLWWPSSSLHISFSRTRFYHLWTMLKWTRSKVSLFWILLLTSNPVYVFSSKANLVCFVKSVDCGHHKLCIGWFILHSYQHNTVFLSPLKLTDLGSPSLVFPDGHPFSYGPRFTARSIHSTQLMHRVFICKHVGMETRRAKSIASNVYRPTQLNTYLHWTEHNFISRRI